MKEQIEEIPLENITIHLENRRVGGFDKEKLKEMAESIRTVGILQPAMVRRIDGPPKRQKGKYEIVAGVRRLRAATIARLPTLPCLVRDIGDQEVQKYRIIENLQREDVHALDEAAAYKKLEAAGCDIEQIAKDVGKSASYVYQRLKLLELLPEARAALIGGSISAGHAILIARLDPQQQKEAAEYCLPKFTEQRPISVRELDRHIHNEIMIDLAKAPFKKDDADLLSKAGACMACSRRTGAAPKLFPDARGKDLCLDRTCHNKKLDALVERKRKELASGEEQSLEVCQGYLQSSRPKGSLSPSEWTECRKKEEGAQRALIVSGPERGKITWGKKHESYNYEPSAEDKEETRRRKEKEKILKAVQLQVWEEVIGRVQSDIEESAGGMPDELLRLVARGFFESLWAEHQERLCRMQEWELPPKENYENSWDRPGWGIVGSDAIGFMPAKELPLFLIKCALINDRDVHISRWEEEETEKEREGSLREAARILGIDIDAIERRVREEHGTPKRGKKPNGTPKRAEPTISIEQAVGAPKRPVRRSGKGK